MSSSFSTLPSDELASLRTRLDIARSALREIAMHRGSHWTQSRAEVALSFIEGDKQTDWGPVTQI